MFDDTVIPVDLSGKEDRVPHSPEEPLVAAAAIVSDDDGDDGTEIAGDLSDIEEDDDDALDNNDSVVESDSDWDDDDKDMNGNNDGDGALSADNLEEWLFPSSKNNNNSPKEEEEEEAVVSEDDVAGDLSMEVLQDERSNDPVAALVQQEKENSNHEVSEEGVVEEQEVVEDALNLIKGIDQEKVSKKEQQQQEQQPQEGNLHESKSSTTDKDYFEPTPEAQVAQRKMEETRTSKELELEALRNREDHYFEPTPEAQVAQRKMQETRTSKELELEALRNRGLAGRKSKQLKKTINQNIKNQMAMDAVQGNMEWRKIGKASDDCEDEDHIEIGAMTTNSTIAATPQLILPTSPSSTEQAVVTSPTMAYEQLALEQQKERLRAKQVEKEIMIQNQLHPESQIKKEIKLLEMDFVFGLLVGINDKAPELKMATKAASKIVPNMLTSKKTIYYDPRYPPKVESIELDPAYIGNDDKPVVQNRYMVRGKVPVLPRKRSSTSSKNQKIPKSPTTNANATVSTMPLTPLTMGSASNSVCSGGGGEAAAFNSAKTKEDLALPTMEVMAPVKSSTMETETTKTAQEELPAVASPNHNEMEGVLEGPLNTSSEDIAMMSPVRVAAAPKLTVNTTARSSSTDIASIRMSKDAELQAIRQRGVAKQKNAGFEQLQAQTAENLAVYQQEQEDLQKRKSTNSKFEFQAGKIVNPHEQLYLAQNKQNRSYRKIQQETLEEYHHGVVSPTTTKAALAVSGGQEDVSLTPSDEEPITEPVLVDPPSLSAKDQEVKRQSPYAKLFQKIRPKSKKSLEVEEEDTTTTDPIVSQPEEPAHNASNQTSTMESEPFDVELDVKSSQIKLEQLRKAKQEELEKLRREQQEKDLDVKSSELKFEQLRKSKVSELEAIRQRGVAKQKNKGFEQLQLEAAQSQAAYEKEQEDLMKRKSRRSEFQFQAGKVVNPHEQLYLQQNKQNRSYRKIQQETLEEYHRVSPTAAAVADGVVEGDGETKKKEEQDVSSVSPSDEEEMTPPPTTAVNDNNNMNTDPMPNEPPSLSTKDKASRKSRYNKLFQKIRPKSKKSLSEEEMAEQTNNASKKETSMEAESSTLEDVKSSEVKLEELRKAKQEELKAVREQHEKEASSSEDVKSSEVKFEQLRQAKQDELKALRERGLQHQTSDGKIRMASTEGTRRVSPQVQQATTPSRKSGGDELVVGFGMVVKTSPSRPSGDLGLNPPGVTGSSPPPTGQEWRAIDDASPSRLKHSSLKNKEAEELARLRQQGLAKRGSQQYAVFEKSSRQSQLEYEAAAQDLERRKSQTSEYVYSGATEINPVDAVYLDHQKWRKDILKEEKEALGLFDEAPEHVDQDDVEGQIPVSNAKFTTTNGYQKWESGDRGAVGDAKKKKKKKKFGGVKSNCGCTIM